MSQQPVHEPPRRSHFEVFCPVQTPLLSILRRFVTDVAEEMGFAPEDVYKIEMAVDEACSNVVLHAYDERDRTTFEPGIMLKLNLEPEALTIHIQDCGKGANVETLKGQRSIHDYQEPGRETYHGLGILIMKEFMDDVEFHACPDTGTTVILRKFLRRNERRSSDAQRSA